MNKNIGTPEQKPENILDSIIRKEKREAISREAKWTAIALALVALAGQQWILNWENIKTLYSPVGNYVQPGGAGFEDYITIGMTIAASAPLVLVLAAMYVFVTGKLEKQEGLAPGHYWVGALLLWVAAKIGNALGFTPVRTAGLRGGTPFSWVGFILGDYASSYGFILFLSSIIVAIFVGRAWKILTTD